MNVALTILVSALATADSCDQPIAGGAGEPRFCRVTDATEVSTPSFSVIVEPDLLVGIHRHGARVVIQESIRQSLVSLVIEAYPLDEAAPVLGNLGKCGSIAADRAKALVCDASSSDTISRTYLIQGQLGVVVANLSYSQTGAVDQAIYERMISSINADASREPDQ